ncbi:hypothetical protein GCM10010991_15300 [Gemmobacter aquaticus]|uniref:Glycosyltransferase 2-like domain-containing protein n=1 Tax=Gemmobacter aquaticus TaxID=490185 RepID=A0A918DC49_9RHOB|nr:glycosyltransferase [Gemmobacter aquaticus]GGO30441.1 hypothetical protein GCM10010991_15300 [Gemmobacter aquaticus]
MTISFILTSYNIRPYLPQCLRSLSNVARPGDEVIVVDDGSTDGSAELIASKLSDFGFGPGVNLQPVCLGANTMGGVGIPANIGLSLATQETVFFVDGDDWIIPEGFNRARAQMLLTPADILIANYKVFDETRQTSSQPADDDKWHKLVHKGDIEILRVQALSLIGVPWRKFYRRGFLQERALRFPEGDFFYEDNPFHWAVCLAAGSIRFLDTAVCQHRVNRPGQTMGESGMALTAFFTHFETISRMLHRRDAEYHLLAVRWLLENMAWHTNRLSAEAFYPYAVHAAAVLSAIPEPIWVEALARSGHLHPVWLVADRLRKGDISGQVNSWEHARLHGRLAEIEAHLADIGKTSKESLDRLRGQDAADRFAAIKATFDMR